MNGRLDLRIIAQPYSEVYWGYFRRLVFWKFIKKYDKLGSFSYSVVIFPSRFPTYRIAIMLPSRFPTSDWAPCIVQPFGQKTRKAQKDFY